jgi:hypothetical protein
MIGYVTVPSGLRNAEASPHSSAVRAVKHGGDLWELDHQREQGRSDIPGNDHPSAGRHPTLVNHFDPANSVD